MDSPGGKGSFKRRQDSFKRRQARLIRMRTLQSGTSSASSAGGAPAAALNHQSSSVINTHTRHKLSSGLTFAISIAGAEIFSLFFGRSADLLEAGLASQETIYAPARCAHGGSIPLAFGQSWALPGDHHDAAGGQLHPRRGQSSPNGLLCRGNAAQLPGNFSNLFNRVVVSWRLKR